MSNYYGALQRSFGSDTAGASRCASQLIRIRAELESLRAQRSDSSLLLATWNIRDFDSNKFGFGPRLPESFYYLAEFIAHFDLVAVQEVNRDLGPLHRLVAILGRDWDYIVTDATEGTGGNSERMAFLYNRKRVWFRKIAGEVVLPEGQLVVSAKEAAKKPQDAPPIAAGNGQQFARSPFLVAFQSNWFQFSLCTVHIYYGAETGAKLSRRIEEIKKLVHFFAARQDKELADAGAAPDASARAHAENYILLGDFNVVSPEHKTMEALKGEGFTVPAAIDGTKVRREGQHFYDQIAVRVKDPRFKVTDGGLLDVFAHIFRDEDRQIYAEKVPTIVPAGDAGEAEDSPTTPEALYRKWRTWQMSDHNPLWIRIETDFTDSYLENIATQ